MFAVGSAEGGGMGMRIREKLGAREWQRVMESLACICFLLSTHIFLVSLSLLGVGGCWGSFALVGGVCYGEDGSTLGG